MTRDDRTTTERDAAQVARWDEPHLGRRELAMLAGYEPHPHDRLPINAQEADEFDASPWRGWLDAAVAEAKHLADALDLIERAQTTKEDDA